MYIELNRMIYEPSIYRGEIELKFTYGQIRNNLEINTRDKPKQLRNKYKDKFNIL